MKKNIFPNSFGTHYMHDKKKILFVYKLLELSTPSQALHIHPAVIVRPCEFAIVLLHDIRDLFALNRILVLENQHLNSDWKILSGKILSRNYS